MRRPARAIGAETAPELRTVVKTGNEAVEAPQSVVGADPFPWRRHEPAAPEGTGGTRSRTVPPQSGRAVGSLVSGKRELREAGRCLKVLKLRTALAAIKFAARMTNRGERGRSVPPHAISPAVYYAAASLSAAQERRREDPSHAILFWLRLWGSLITTRTAQSVSVLPSSVAISIAGSRRVPVELFRPTASPRSPRNQRPSRPRSGYRNRNFAGSGVRVGGAGGVRLLAALMRINYRSARRM
jgi:hypothetical protein